MLNRFFDRQPSTPKDPVSEAALGIAETIHSDLMGELQQGTAPTGFEDSVAAAREKYPAMLFGELAMHLAGVKLPANATPADRARGVVTSLHRIASTPSLFESITDVPFNPDTAQAIGRDLEKAAKADSKETVFAATLRSQIAERGYLERSMLPDNRTIQLCYAGIAEAKKRSATANKAGTQQEIILKLSASENLYWDVKTYGRWAANEGYTKYRATRKVPLQGLFTVLAVDSSGVKANNADALDELVGKPVRIGKVSTNTLLKITHSFSREKKEVPGHEPDIDYKTLSLPLKLQQAYVGSSKDFPLF